MRSSTIMFLFFLKKFLWILYGANLRLFAIPFL